MKAGLKALAAAGLMLICMGQRAPELLDYTLTPIMSDGALAAVEIDLRFRGDADGETELRLPDTWGGRDELWRAVTDLRVRSGAALAEGDGPARRVLSHRPGAAIHLRYRIVQDSEGLPIAGAGNPYRALVQPGYFHLIGHAIFIRPAGREDASPVRARVQRLPRGWAYASDLDHPGLTLGELGRSISVGGDFRVLRGADRNVRVAMRGAWSFSDAEFVAQVNEIIAGQRRFWGDSSTPFLVTVLPLAAPSPRSRSIGGTGLNDAFAFFATPNTDLAQITRTLAHEGLHTWIPRRLGDMPREAEAADYWLSEGFTDFYTGRLLVRQELWTPAAFAADLNQMLQAYALSSARAAPNQRIVDDFWRDREVRQLPYQRGRLLATIWDQRLRANGQSLDTLLRAIAADAGQATAAARFAEAAEAAGIGFAADYAAHVESGAPIMLPEDVFAPCGVVEEFRAPRFAIGFDFEATRANGLLVYGTDPEGPAYAAGLRDGMTITHFSADMGNTDIEVQLGVRDESGERALSYLPRARETTPMQRFVIAEPLEGAALAQCLAVLGGA